MTACRGCGLQHTERRQVIFEIADELVAWSNAVAPKGQREAALWDAWAWLIEKYDDGQHRDAYSSHRTVINARHR